MIARTIFVLSAIALILGQQVGTNQPEVHPSLTSKKCTKSGGCQDQPTSIVLDANWRWLHTKEGYTNCYTGNKWDASLCPDAKTCAQNCALEGANYPGTYGITTQGDALTLNFVTRGQYGNNVGSRVFLTNPSGNYTLFNLLNKEFTIDVDVSKLPCGLNGALYFVSMDEDGGKKYALNKAGSQYGTGYCDAQCPHDLKFINGEANVEGWVPSSNNPNSGSGKYGTCCPEMDIWEANSESTAFTPHPCTKGSKGSYKCTGKECGDGDNRYGGVCDKDGCDFNSFRMGDQQFFGKGKTVDTTQKFTVVTQFIAPNGKLTEIRRKYVQNGKTIQNSKTKVAGMDPYDSVTNAFCSAQKKTFGDKNDFVKKGGLEKMGRSLEKMVLVMSLWDDYEARMLWLDSNYPANKSPSTPGVSRGPCPTSSGVPTDVESQYPNASVTYSNIRIGEIGSTA